MVRGMRLLLLVALLATPVASASVRVVETASVPEALRETSDVQLVFTVENVGDTTVCPCSAAWLHFAVGEGGPHEQIVPAIAPGERVRVTSHVAPPPARTKLLEVALQLTDLETYRDVGDGVYHPFPVALDGRPNLTFELLALEPAEPRRGDFARLRALARNDGNVSLPQVVARLEDASGRTLASAEPRYLVPGAALEVETSWRVDREPLQLRAVAEARGDPEETRAERSIVVTPAARDREAAPERQPDLVAVSGDAKCPCGHYLYTDYKIVVRNDGLAPAENFTVRLGAERARDGEHEVRVAGPLEPGAETIVPFRSGTRPTGGVPILVDVFDDVWESNEENNERLLDVRWETPGPGALVVLVALVALALARRGQA